MAFFCSNSLISFVYSLSSNQICSTSKSLSSLFLEDVVRCSSTWSPFPTANIIPICTVLIAGAIILTTFTMIPKTFWSSAPAAIGTPESSVPKSLQNEKVAQQKQARARSRKRWYIGVIATIMLVALVLGLSLGLTLGRKHHGDVNPDGPIIDLNYTRYQGSDLHNGVNQWLGIRYAAPPVGDLRFAAPQDPLKNTTVQKANKVCHKVEANVMITNPAEARPNLPRYA